MTSLKEEAKNMSKIKYQIIQTDNGNFPPIFDRDTQKRFNCQLRLVNISTEEESIFACRNAHLVLATRGLFTKKVLEKMKDCLAIIRFGVGVENIDIKSATKLGIIIANVPDFCVDEVSDTVIAAILALNRKLFFLHKTIIGGRWDRRLARPITRIKNQTLGLIGFGRIARAVAAKMKGFGLNIIAYDPYIKKQEIKRFSVRPVDFNYILKQSDFISLHLPLNNETYHLIEKKQLRKMKHNAYLINTSRGKIIDEVALYKALKEGWIAGAALDVLDEEPPDFKNPILKLDNMIFTPHFASYSEEAFEELEKKVREAAIMVLKGRFPSHIVNPDVKSSARLITIKKLSGGRHG